GSTDLDVVYADKTGVYLQESHLALKSYFVIGASMRSSAALIKLDKNLTEQYRNDFNKELKGKEFEQFFVLQDKMLLIASDYSKRSKTLDIYAAEIDKNSGDLSGEWKQLTSFQKEEKKDDINFKITLNADSTKMVVVSSIEGKEKNNYQVQEFDKDLTPTGKPVEISNEFDPKTFQLEDVLYTINRKIILVGRIYEYEEGKKKKNKFLDFANYNIRLYDEKGKQETEVNTNINGKWLISTKLVQKGDKDLVLAAFYNNVKRGKAIDGMMVQRINPVTGTVISTSEKEINNSLLTTGEDSTAEDAGNDDETKAERKEREKLDKIKDEGEGFSSLMQFRNIFYTPDDGLVFLAEKYHHYTYTTQSYTPGANGFSSSYSTTTYSVYECGDLMMCKVDASGNIGWLKVLPKAQREVIAEGYSNSFVAPGFFDPANRPFYAGFGALEANNSVNIIFNDNPKNAVVTQPGQKVKRTTRFGKSDCFVVSLNELTGKYTRNQFFSNTMVPTSMPRLGSVIGDNMYIVGKDDQMLGKSKIAIAKITVD
ncbi:MAG: hypothetical protein ACRDE5_03875, partial [Ginsengibacter sp.]